MTSVPHERSAGEMWPEVHVDDDFGRRMREARERLGMTQRQLADAVGLAQFSISALENSKQRSSRDIIPICRVLKISPPFVGVSDDMEWRWIEAGKALRGVAPDLFAALLQTAEEYLKRQDPE
jgi:transcriptional regulator with XRE-family HTH domain